MAAEIRFPGDLGLMARWGSLQRALPEFEKLYVPNADAGKAPLLQHMQLATADEKTRLLLAINSFAYVTRDYHSFEPFEAELERLLGIFLREASVAKLNRIGLRYTNLLPPLFPGVLAPGQLHPCLKLRVLTGLDAVDADLAEQSQLVYKGRRGDLRITVQLLATEGASLRVGTGTVAAPGVTFDVDVHEDATDGRPLEPSRALLVIRDAHKVADEVFFGLVTDEYLSYLEGGAQR